MRTFTSFVRVMLAIILIFNTISVNAALAAGDSYSPDNSAKPDPLNSAKHMQRNLQVGEFTGAGIFNYPLGIPTGRNGLTPSVNITYNSQDSSLSNIIGYQWNLNLYSIKRVNKSGVEKLYSQNDFVATTPVGGGELVEIQLGSGQYGEYGQKIERSFAKYEYRSDSRWVVTDKSGTQYIFGTSDSTRQFDPADSTRIYQWMLEEIRDRNDNFIRYTYFKHQGQIYPKTIHYTGHGTEDGIFEIRFLPFTNDDPGEARADSHYGFSAGFKIETSALVTGIEVYAEENLRRKYDIAYTSVDPLIRQTIGSITETGYTKSGATTSLPPTTFEYTPSQVSWEETTDYAPQWLFEHCYVNCEPATYYWDMNGDALIDFETVSGNNQTRYLNDGKGGWIEAPAQFVPSSSAYFLPLPNPWQKLVDFDGDARMDLLKSYIGPNSARDGNQLYSHLNLASGTNINETIAIAMGSNEAGKPDNGGAIADLNGDGLPDIIQGRMSYGVSTRETCLNNGGTSCELTDLWITPKDIILDGQWDQAGRQVYVQDSNDDGLADVYFSGSGAKSWMNDGKGGWLENLPGRFIHIDRLTNRSLDANGDGQIDSVLSQTTITSWGQITDNKLNIYTGEGSQTYEWVFPINLGYSGGGSYHNDNGVRIIDLNGDKLPDVMQSLRVHDDKGNITETKKVYMNKGTRPYFLKTVRKSSGSVIDLEYKTSAQYMKNDGTLANPDLPIILTTVSKITVDDGLGNKSFTDYFYEDGHYFFKDSSDRELAGFRIVTKTDGLGFVTKNYYHQGELSVNDEVNGEFNDHISKKGMPYRMEGYDDRGNLIKATINKYEKTDLGSDRFHPFLKQTVTIDYDPDSTDQLAMAKEFTYDSFGNPTEAIDYGEVELSDRKGSFTDVGSDLLRQESSFINNAELHIIGLPFEQKTFDQTDQLLGHNKIYFDDLALGDVNVGNPTKNETWLNTTDSFLVSTVIYNEFGLPIQQTNPRGHSMGITYDSNKLYPQNKTNPLGHSITYEYDVATGNLLQSADPNNAQTKNIYDGLGRLIQTEITNPKTSALITSKIVSYSDANMPRSAKQTALNDEGQTIETYSYIDGLGRTIETKQKGSNGQWVTAGSIFDERGNVTKSIQVYSSGSSNFEAVDSSRIGTGFIYDALGRVTSATDALGTTATRYELLNKSVTDPNGKVKDFAYSARGQLTQVSEHVGFDIHSTKYTHDSAGQMIQITDALGNVRDFTYDNLGRRLTQTDAYKPGQTGSLWQYEYDENSNLTKRTDPLDQTVEYAFDAIDRATQEDFLGEVGTEYTYIYDQGQNAIGRLTSVNGNNYQHNFEYDALGRVIRDQKQIDGRDFLFSYDFDLMGGVKKMTYPDDMEVFYEYDNVHQLKKVYSEGRVYADQFNYTPLGQMSSIHLGNDVVTTNTYSPEKMYRLIQKQSLLMGVVRLQDFKYEYDAMGNLMKLTDESNAETSKIVDYLYDDLYRVTEARYTNTGNYEFITMNYQYDPIGNMIYKSDVGIMKYNHSNPHALTQVGDRVYEYDPIGNMIDHDGNSMTYDYKNRLIESGDGSTYVYDEGGKRIKKNDKFYPNKYYEINGGKETKFIYVGKQKIAKVTRFLIEPPTVEEVVESIEDPSYTFRGTKEVDLSLWVNGLELLPVGSETEWEYATDLQIGENRFDFYTKENEDTISKTITRIIDYTMPTPTVEIPESSVESTRVLLKGTKRTGTSLWLSDVEIIPLGIETDWEYEVPLMSEQNQFNLLVKDRLSQASESVQFGITYFATPPTVDDFVQPVKENPLTIRGTKRAGMGIWVNGQESISASDDTAWQIDLILTEGVNTFTITAQSEFGVESNGVILNIPYNVVAPIIDPIQSPTSDAMVTITGSKRAYTSVWINGEEVIPMNAEEFWGYTVELSALHNEFIVLTKDEEGLASTAITLTLDYDAVPPAVDPITPSTNNSTYIFSGTKPAGTAIYINGTLAVPADATTVWFAEMPLQPGENHFKIITKSKFGVTSDPVEVDVIYTPSITSVSSAPVSPSSGGGGGYRTPILSPFLQKRMEEKEAQIEEIQAKEDGENATQPIDSDDPKVIADLILYSQSGNRTNTPKAIWPTAESKTGVEFKNLQIIYRSNKAMLKWSKMSKEVATFDIYRSKYAYPDRRSKHANQKVTNIKASTFKNRFEDKSFENSEQFTYQIVALNHNGQIIKASIQLNPNQIFIAQDGSTKVDFKKYSDLEFNKVYISDHNHLEFEKTRDPQKMNLTPKGGFKAGTKIHVRFINCTPKINTGEFCEAVEEKILDVYAIKKPRIARRAKKVASTILNFLIPTSQAAPPAPEEKIYYFLSDHLGSTDIILKENGDVIRRTDYLPFGSERLRVEGTTSVEDAYGFTGKELDEETGLYYYGARYYDPITGRFTQLDPLILGESSKSFGSALANPQALNSYAYTLNNPLKYVDENGEYEEGIHYDLTYVLGLVAGLSQETSKTIAYEDQNMDDNPATSPGGYKSVQAMMTTAKNLITGVIQDNHFVNRAEVYGRLYQAKKNQSAIEFGQAMHTFQDTYSHGKFFSSYPVIHKFAPLGHGLEMHKPDKTYLRPGLANDMASTTFYQLRSYKLATDGLGDMNLSEYNAETSTLWNKAFDMVDSYNKSENKSDTSISSAASSSKFSLEQGPKEDK